MVNMGNAGYVEEVVKKEENEKIVSEQDIETIQQKHETVKNYHATIGAMFCQMMRIASQFESSNEDLRNFVKNTILQQGIPEKEVEDYVIRLSDGKIVKSDKKD